MVISRGVQFKTVFHLWPYTGTAMMVYQVTNAYLIQEQSTAEYIPNIFEHYFIWKEKLHLSACHVIVPVCYRLTIHLEFQKGFAVYDGPGILSEQISIDHSNIELSSFQAYILLFTTKWPAEKNTIKDYGVKYSSERLKGMEVNVPETGVIPIPDCICTNSSVYTNLLDMKNCHCLYYLKAESGYVNITVSKLTYSGFNYEVENLLTDRVKCMQGGIFYENTKDRTDFKNFKNTQSFCDNYESVTESNPTSYKSLPSFISDTEDGAVFAVYSFRFYSRVTAQVRLAATPCRGIVYDKGQ